MTLRGASPSQRAAHVAEPCVIAIAPPMLSLLAAAKRVAAAQTKVLVTGESGVGKDLIARYIHSHSPRAQASFVAVNCAGLSETLLESELFGHVRGSYTNAHCDTVGRLQLANHGTIFLDEVGEMSPRMQALLLRFLENGEIQRVGSDSVVARVDVRVVAATNRDLTKMVADGQFREDLLYRIRGRTSARATAPGAARRHSGARPACARQIEQRLRPHAGSDGRAAALLVARKCP